MVEIAVNPLFRHKPQPLQHGEIAGEPDGDGGKDDVEGDREAELDAGEIKGADAKHCRSLSFE